MAGKNAIVGNIVTQYDGTGVNKALSDFQKFQQAQRGVGISTGSLTSGLTRLGGLIGAGLSIQEGINLFYDYEKSLKRIELAYGKAFNRDEAKKFFSDLSKDVGKSKTELAGLYSGFAGSGFAKGLSTSGQQDILKKILDISARFNISSKSLLDAIIGGNASQLFSLLQVPLGLKNYEAGQYSLNSPQQILSLIDKAFAQSEGSAKELKTPVDTLTSTLKDLETTVANFLNPALRGLADNAELVKNVLVGLGGSLLLAKGIGPIFSNRVGASLSSKLERNRAELLTLSGRKGSSEFLYRAGKNEIEDRLKLGAITKSQGIKDLNALEERRLSNLSPLLSAERKLNSEIERTNRSLNNINNGGLVKFNELTKQKFGLAGSFKSLATSIAPLILPTGGFVLLGTIVGALILKISKWADGFDKRTIEQKKKEAIATRDNQLKASAQSNVYYFDNIDKKITTSRVDRLGNPNKYYEGSKSVGAIAETGQGGSLNKSALIAQQKNVDYNKKSLEKIAKNTESLDKKTPKPTGKPSNTGGLDTTGAIYSFDPIEYSASYAKIAESELNSINRAQSLSEIKANLAQQLKGIGKLQEEFVSALDKGLLTASSTSSEFKTWVTYLEKAYNIQLGLSNVKPSVVGDNPTKNEFPKAPDGVVFNGTGKTVTGSGVGDGKGGTTTPTAGTGTTATLAPPTLSVNNALTDLYRELHYDITLNNQNLKEENDRQQTIIDEALRNLGIATTPKNEGNPAFAEARPSTVININAGGIIDQSSATKLVQEISNKGNSAGLLTFNSGVNI